MARRNENFFKEVEELEGKKKSEAQGWGQF